MLEIKYFLLGLFAIVNLIAFLLMFIDKIKSTNKKHQRISEGMLFFMAVCFGSIGVYAGMFAFRHKTRKWYFVSGILLVVLQNFATIFYILLLIKDF